MSDEKENASICVSLDLKKFRIRIHRHLLQMLGRPAYIQLMVNPKTKVLAIASGDQHDHLSHRVDWAALEGKASYELYSRNLLMTLLSVCPELHEGNSYKIKGQLKHSSNVAEFKISKCTDISSNETI